jgi:predicted DNA-binding transcriptional regulator AlpA
MQNPFDEITERLNRIEDCLLSLKSAPKPEDVHLIDIGNIQIAVDETGLSSHSIYRLVCERRIPHFKKGGRLYFSRKAVRNWIEEGRR